MKTNVYIEEGLNPETLKSGFVSEEDDHTRRHGLPRLCADAFVIYEHKGIKGILTAYRDDGKPLPNALWIPGGMWPRGVPSAEMAAAANLKRETGLDMVDMDVLAHDSFFWKDSPYDDEVKYPGLKESRAVRKLGEGLHEVGFAVFGRAKGELTLKSMREPVIIITWENYHKIVAEHIKDEFHGQCAAYFKGNVAKALERM